MHHTHILLGFALGSAGLLGCERSDGHAPQAGTSAVVATAAPAVAPTPMPLPMPVGSGTGTGESAIATGVDVWEGKPRWSITFTATPEPSGLPVGAFRAATRMCLDESHAPAGAETTLDLRISTQGGHVKTVDAGDAAVAPPLVACLQRLYAKITVADGGATRFVASVRAKPATD